MEDFLIYLGLGFDHITDPGGYDHILFVIALCTVYPLRQWRQVLILVTAFTIGHSITLALATLRIIRYDTNVIEFLIPVTILITAFSNFFYQDRQSPFATRQTRHRGPSIRYGLALLFGLIHGMGFSNYLRSLLGTEADIWQPLLAFNLGLELGQLVIVSIVLLIGFLAQERLSIRKHDWRLVVSGIVTGMAISLILTSKLLQGDA